MNSPTLSMERRLNAYSWKRVTGHVEKVCRLALALRLTVRLGQVGEAELTRDSSQTCRVAGAGARAYVCSDSQVRMLRGIGTQGSHRSAATTVIRDILAALGVSDPVPH